MYTKERYDKVVEHLAKLPEDMFVEHEWTFETLMIQVKDLLHRFPSASAGQIASLAWRREVARIPLGYWPGDEEEEDGYRRQQEELLLSQG